MKAEKNYQIKVSAIGAENTFASVFGKTPKTALSAAKRLYPDDYEYRLWSLRENGEWGYDYNIGKHGYHEE